MDSIIAITYSFLLTFMPYHHIAISENKVEKHQNPTHVEMQLGVDLFDFVHFYASEETYQVPVGNLKDDTFEFFPYRQSYYLGVELHKKFNDSFEITGGVGHKCMHPPLCWNQSMSISNEAYTEIYVNVSGKIKAF